MRNRTWGTATVVLAAAVTVAVAQDGAAGEAGRFSAGKLFTFLFVTLGPFKVLAPFAKMTRGRDAAFKRRLALQGIVIAMVAALVAATVGVSTLEKWGISLPALLLTAGIILFLVALQPVLRQYAKDEPPADAAAAAAAPPPPASAMAFSPLAFPTIVTPYGIAVLIIAVTLSPDTIPLILGLVGFVFLLDFLAMLAADRVMGTPVLASGFAILGAVLGVLQMALGVQAAMSALKLLG